MHLCKAITAKGKPCTRVATHRDYCHWHGGQYVPIKFIESLSPEVGPRYNELYNNPDILSMRHEIALIDGRLEALIARQNTGESGENWKKLNEAMQRYHDAVAAKDAELQDHCISDIDGIIKTRYADTVIWNNIHAIIEQRRRLVATEQKYMVINRTYVLQDDLAKCGTALTTAIRSTITDPQLLEAIDRDFERILGLNFGNFPDMPDESDETDESDESDESDELEESNDTP